MNAAVKITDLPQDPAKKVKRSTFQFAEHAYGRHSARLPVGWTIEDVLAPESWSEVAHLLDGNKMSNTHPQVGAVIEVRTEDHAFYAELYVRAVRKMALDIALIGEVTYFGKKDEKPASDAYKPRWNVGAGGYDIVRKDGAIVGRAADFKLKEDAFAYIRDVLKG